jgi:hypothetical protein
MVFEQSGSLQKHQWATSLNLLVALWLVMTPTLSSYHGQAAATWNQVVVGVTVAVIALLRTNLSDRWARLSLVNIGLGSWLIIVPVLLAPSAGFGSEIYWNDLIGGVAIVSLACVRLLGGPRGNAQR